MMNATNFEGDKQMTIDEKIANIMNESQGDNTMNCSACSGQLVNSDLHHAVQECKDCGAIISSGISRGDVARFVNLTPWDQIDGAQPFSNSLRFFDFTILNGNGSVNRVHGWFNHFSKKVVQIG